MDKLSAVSPPGVRRSSSAGAEVQDAQEVGDALLYARLVTDGFSGPVWDRVTDRLVRYALPILTAWIRTGQVVSECRRAGARGLPEDLNVVPGDVADLLQDTLFEGLVQFRRRGMAGVGWRPEGGASLTSYFITSCLYGFTDVHRRYRTTRREQAAAVSVGLLEEVPGGDDVAQTATVRQEARQRLQEISDERTRRAIAFTAEGYSQAEIAHLLRTSPRAVEGLLHRHRKTHREYKDGGGA